MSADIDVAPTLADLARWFTMKAELGRLKSAEGLLRARLFRHWFPTPTEGTNTTPLNDGTGALLKGVHVINRDVDPASLDALRASIVAEGSNLPKLDFGKLIKWKPEVVIKEYRTLTEEERNLFDQCLIVKPGSPQMEVKVPGGGA